MNKLKIKAAYNELAESYSRLIEHKPHNAYYDRPNTLSLLEDVNNKSVLDAACGPGKYAEILLSKNAHVTGFDFSSEMIKFAKERNQSKGKFFVHDLSSPLTMIDDKSFDFVLCALALHYIEDWNLTIKEFHRVLKTKGQLIISIEHPFFEYNYYESKDYFKTEPVKCIWSGFGKPIEINSHRRPLHDCISPLTKNGFYIDKLIEPKPLKEFEKLDQKHYEELIEFPAFMCLRAVKK
ncbi:class I SAM-dependent methyltransferase [Croceitalea sp. MTPC9]|uniref:Class I SAM-dependent methyltransferase n=1 Tax=Croceitalea marina TaxID=1775166 RepID=A0ABW5N1K7_9FLAO|nr:class I SAM-dependent methyltransferase [Croceitalea sp. MTPC5]GMN11387.1 class I SAM-dependent methyltransferase [Croceitalea sp. MTPC6]GMN16070.1 class I SAM-dependent methyltransferase [Croceitalea sp. MTPC9]